MTARRPEGLTASLLIGPATLIVMLSLVLPLAVLARYSLNQYDRKTFMEIGRASCRERVL